MSEGATPTWDSPDADPAGDLFKAIAEYRAANGGNVLLAGSDKLIDRVKDAGVQLEKVQIGNQTYWRVIEPYPDIGMGIVRNEF